MERYKYIIPEESQDAIMGNVATLRKIESRLRDVFEASAYNEVLMPSFEYADLYSEIATGVEVERLFQFFNKEGKAVALRADFTFPLARLHATRTNCEVGRYSYFGKVYRKEQRHKGRSSEIFQAGIELMGLDLVDGDKECLKILSQSLSAINVGHIKIEIGSAAFFQRLVERLEDTDGQLAMILQKRDLSAMKIYANEKFNQGMIDENDILFLNQLPRMFGKKEIFNEVYPYIQDKILLDILSHLETLYDEYQEQFEDLTIDLAMVPKFNYYTGLMIQGYNELASESIINGGRYDQLLSVFGKESKAIGLSYNLNRILEIVESRDK